jgi:dihydrolipoamide dehydrogenase
VTAGKDRVWDHRALPAVCFTDPEIFAVGIEPEVGGDSPGTSRDAVVNAIRRASERRAEAP